MKYKLSKRIISALLAIVMLVGLLPTAVISAFAAEEPENEIGEVSDADVVEVSSWDEFKEAFELSDYSGKSYTIKLMEDLHFDAADALRSATALVEVDVNGCFVTLDFNGHTLSCKDDVSSSDFESVLSDFIRINLHPINRVTPIEFVLTDSAGGGGVTMDSSRAYDNQLAALRVYDTRRYVLYGYLAQSTSSGSCKLTINGGNYTLNSNTEFWGRGTCDPNYDYRGTVIADELKAVEINGGTFVANGGGLFDDWTNGYMSARELSAFATCTTGSRTTKEDMTGQTVINGGTFISNGYSIHHFDISKTLGDAKQELFPMINGGVFVGGIAYIGKTFTYSDGWEEYENKKAADIINNDAYVLCIKDGSMYGLDDDLDLKDLHDADSLYVLSESLFELNTLPDVGEITDIERYTEQSETYQVQYKVPYGFTEDQITPYISVTPTGGTETTYQTTEKVIDYSEYPNGLTVEAGIAFRVAGEVVHFEKVYNVAVSEVPSAPEILAQPRSMTVAPGECAEAMVVANHAQSYQWYYLYDGDTPVKLTDSVVSAMGGGIAGYLDAILSVKLNGVGREYFYCVVTGTDGSTVKTDRISFTFGASPSVIGADGGEFYDGQSAKFNLWAHYADEVEWVVMERGSGSTKFYSLEEFAAETGCQYGTAHRSYITGVHNASVLFQNVPASWANKYSVGYTLKNSLGTLSFDPDAAIPFALAVVRPQITSLLETVPDEAGEKSIFTFEAENMVDAEWTFEKPDDEGVILAYTLDEMKADFPETSFVTAVLGNTATLTVSNAALELGEYLVCANAVGTSASTFAGSALFRLPAGLTVSGMVTSFGSETDYITVQLYPEGSASAAHTVVVVGNYMYYYIADVKPGNYTLKAYKEGHQTYEQTITVGDQSVMIDIVMRKALMITTQPKTTYTANGATAKATVMAEGDGLTYQWYVKNAGGSSYSKSSCKTATYSCKMSSASKDRYVRCKITDQYGTVVWTNTVWLRMKVGIEGQPANQNVKEGATAKFTVSAVGSGLTYQWQYRTSSSGSWKNASATGNKTAVLSVPATVSRNGYQYRCQVTDSGNNKVYTNVVKLSVLGIKAQPVNQTVVAGKTAKFTVSATGSGLKYQWQYRTSSSGSWAAAKADGNTTATMSVPATVSRHGYQYRCKITDGAGNTLYTKIVKLYVLGIKTQPANQTVKEGAAAKFTVVAVGNGLSYQWQYRTSSKDSWKNASATGNKTATVSVPGTASRNGYQYRCKITDSAGNVIYTDIVKLTVK